MGTKGPKAIPVTSRAKRSLDSCGPAPLKQTGEKSWINQAGHLALDIAGLVPGIGEIADGANAAWYAGEGDYKNAALSAAAMVPFAGWAATGAKLGMKGYSKASKAVKGVDKLSNAGFTVGKKLFKSKAPKVTVNTITGLSQPFKSARFYSGDRYDGVPKNSKGGSAGFDPTDSRKQDFINATKNEIAKNKKTKNTNSKKEGSSLGSSAGRQFYTPGLDTPENMRKVNNRNKVKTKPVEKPKPKSNATSDTSWKKASKASGGNLSKLVKARNSAKKGSPEYAKAQNAINKAYGSKKRY